MSLIPQLNLARVSGKVGPERFPNRVAENRGVGKQIVELIELHAVEEIVKFKAHVEFQALVNSYLLVQDHIRVGDARPRK